MEDEQFIKDIVKGFRRMIILLMLSKESMHGYEIIKKFNDLFNVEYPTSLVYPMLRDMESNGSIKSIWVQEGERKKRLYEITSQGAKILKTHREIFEGPAKEMFKEIIGW